MTHTGKILEVGTQDSVSAESTRVCSPNVRARLFVGQDSDVELSAEESFEALSGEDQAEWDTAVEKLGGPIYMTYDWLRVWWTYYGRGTRLRLYRLRREGVLVGLLPIYIEDFGFGPAKFRVARLVGANAPPKSFDPPIDSSVADRMLPLVLERIITQERCDLLSLGPVSAEWGAAECLEKLSGEKEMSSGVIEKQQVDVQIVFDLPDTFDSYLQQLTPKERKSRTKRLRQLERKHEIASKVVRDSEVLDAEFESFVSLHSKQWNAVGKAGHFHSWPSAVEYNRELVATQGAKGRVRFFNLRADGETISNRYTFLCGETLYSELPARAIGEPWDKLGIGSTSLLKFNESVIAEGIKSVDSGLGGYSHKANLGGREVPVNVWRAFGKSTWSRAKARTFLLVSRITKLVCHKMWYRRVLPHLPFVKARSQAMWWLRYEA